MSKVDSLLTAAQVAEIRGVTPKTVHRWAEAGRLPIATKLPGLRGAYLFHRADVEALAAERTKVSA